MSLPLPKCSGICGIEPFYIMRRCTFHDGHRGGGIELMDIPTAKSMTPRGVPSLQVPLQNLNTQTGPTRRRGRPETTRTAVLSTLRAFAGNGITLSLYHLKHANGITRYATPLIRIFVFISPRLEFHRSQYSRNIFLNIDSPRSISKICNIDTKRIWKNAHHASTSLA